ncbi:MAG: hypothetical protein QM767_29100 [Anaeromyxobacter sp.]
MEELAGWVRQYTVGALLVVAGLAALAGLLALRRRAARQGAAPEDR